MRRIERSQPFLRRRAYPALGDQRGHEPRGRHVKGRIGRGAAFGEKGDGGDGAGLGPPRDVRELARVALVEGFGVNVIAMGQAPEPRPELDDHVRTALARAVVGGELHSEALTQAELYKLRRDGFSAGKLSDDARRRGFDAVKARLGAAQLSASGPLLARLVDAWLDDLERILGGIKEGDVDPRFVEAVLVEMKRS